MSSGYKNLHHDPSIIITYKIDRYTQEKFYSKRSCPRQMPQRISTKQVVVFFRGSVLSEFKNISKRISTQYHKAFDYPYGFAGYSYLQPKVDNVETRTFQKIVIPDLSQVSQVILTIHMAGAQCNLLTKDHVHSARRRLDQATCSKQFPKDNK